MGKVCSTFSQCRELLSRAANRPIPDSTLGGVVDLMRVLSRQGAKRNSREKVISVSFHATLRYRKRRIIAGSQLRAREIIDRTAPAPPENLVVSIDPEFALLKPVCRIFGDKPDPHFVAKRSSARFVERYAQSADRSVERIESIRPTGCLLAHTSRDGDPIRLKKPRGPLPQPHKIRRSIQSASCRPDVADGFPQIRHRRFNLAVRPVGQRFKFLQNGLAGIGARDVERGEECNDKAV